ncbi:DUF5687 family protein [Anditalea andensis]|uniref:Uncharacterized protein n=1 Tax=Anditalea andensis TaxID=1048983 RepID=A0A074KZJ7_9BACT|nr:DUF5687 family protein [Anditalea andensis]KEO74354.1 hypothetical protein EL17_06355 [Anditalea andensis]
MIFELIRLEFLKASRSSSFGKSLAVGIFLFLLAIVLLLYILALGLALKYIITEVIQEEDAYSFLSGTVIYFFLFEFMYRYFIQKLPVIELESLLHLPISKSKIINFLLLRSFISPLSIIALLLFMPFTIMEVAPRFGIEAAIYWLGTLVFTSWSLHWVMLWFKQQFDDTLTGIIIVFSVMILGIGSTYYGWYNLGEILKPVFDYALESPIPLVIMIGFFLLTYYLAYQYYVKNAYLEDLGEEEQIRFANRSLGIFSRLGLAGEMADLEWKLIIRHKKSRSYLMLSGFFLLYGLIFYTNPTYRGGEGVPFMFIFVGAFITGIFMLQYGQLFLSWNSSNFDFFLNRRGGVEALVKGKYYLFIASAFMTFLLSVPYVYFGWDVLMIHLVTFLFNLGVTIHLVVYLALWKPKPMDINKGAVFNYEGIGIAQFLMIIPMMGAPYLIYIPMSLMFGDVSGLLALGTIGITGIICFPLLSDLAVQKVIRNKYQISASFRQEL